jgi:hypothetical protein
MEEEITELKILLQEMAEDARSQTNACLTPEQLVAYHFKKLPNDEAGRAQSHLALCRECASLLIDIAEFSVPKEDEPSQSPHPEFEAAWAELRAMLPPSLQTPSSLQSSEPGFFQRLRQLMFSLRPAHALAAISLVVGLSLAVWVVSLNREKRELIAQMSRGQGGRDALAEEVEIMRRQGDEARSRVEQLKAQVDKLKRPQLNVQIKDLPPGGTRAEGDPRLVDIELLPGEKRFDLILQSPEQDYPDYAIEILDRSGAPVANEEGLIPNKKAGVFTISFPRESLPPGEYRFNVYGIRLGKKTRVSGYILRISHKPRG